MKISKAACLIFAVAVMHASAFNGAVVLSGAGGAADADRPAIVALDVCGGGPHAAAVQAFDAAPVPVFVGCCYFPSISLVPPRPAKAPATADPGEIEKPPKA